MPDNDYGAIGFGKLTWTKKVNDMGSYWSVHTKLRVQLDLPPVRDRNDCNLEDSNFTGLADLVYAIGNEIELLEFNHFDSKGKTETKLTIYWGDNRQCSTSHHAMHRKYVQGIETNLLYQNNQNDQVINHPLYLTLPSAQFLDVFPTEIASQSFGLRSYPRVIWIPCLHLFNLRLFNLQVQYPQRLYFGPGKITAAPYSSNQPFFEYFFLDDNGVRHPESWHTYTPAHGLQFVVQNVTSPQEQPQELVQKFPKLGLSDSGSITTTQPSLLPQPDPATPPQTGSYQSSDYFQLAYSLAVSAFKTMLKTAVKILIQNYVQKNI